MSETDKPQPDPDPSPQQSGAEAPTQPDQPAPQPEPQAQPAQAPPAQPAAVAAKPPHMVRTWLAAAIGAVVLVGAGLGGYFIGAANDHDRDRPGATRYDHRPGGPGFRDDGPGFRGDLPNRGPR